MSFQDDSGVLQGTAGDFRSVSELILGDLGGFWGVPRGFIAAWVFRGFHGPSRSVHGVSRRFRGFQERSSSIPTMFKSTSEAFHRIQGIIECSRESFMGFQEHFKGFQGVSLAFHEVSRSLGKF